MLAARNAFQVSGKVQYGSVALAGTGDYLSIPMSSALQMGTGDYTIECWIYFTSLTNKIIYCDRNANTVTGVLLRTSSANKLLIYASTNAGSSYDIALVGATTLTANTWTHVAATRNGVTWRLFVNGTLDGTATSAYPGASIPQVGPALIGYDPGLSLYCSGNISNLRIVKGTALYTASFTKPTAPLTAISGTGLLTANRPDAVVDDSGNGFTVTKYGTAAAGTANPF